MAAHADHSKPYFPRAGVATDGYSNDEEATATCFCGAVQMAFPLSPTSPRTVFICHCPDCRKITASMFATNFSVPASQTRHLRGQENLTAFPNRITPVHNHLMTNYFCRTCGSLMYRVGEAFPDTYIMRVGTVDDFSLAETRLRPRVEQFVGTRVGWLDGVEGSLVEYGEGEGKKRKVVRAEGMHDFGSGSGSGSGGGEEKRQVQGEAKI